VFVNTPYFVLSWFQCAYAFLDKIGFNFMIADPDMTGESFAIPSMNNPEAENPDKWFDLYIDSHGGDARQIRAVWYNNKIRGKGTRNETRVTNPLFSG
jgi:hypothetical protein